MLYIGTFGTFIGFGFAFGQVLNQTFLAGMTGGSAPTAAQTAAASLHAAQIAFVGPLLGRSAASTVVAWPTGVVGPA